MQRNLSVPIRKKLRQERKVVGDAALPRSLLDDTGPASQRAILRQYVILVGNLRIGVLRSGAIQAATFACRLANGRPRKRRPRRGNTIEDGAHILVVQRLNVVHPVLYTINDFLFLALYPSFRAKK